MADYREQMQDAAAAAAHVDEPDVHEVRELCAAPLGFAAEQLNRS